MSHISIIFTELQKSNFLLKISSGGILYCSVPTLKIAVFLHKTCIFHGIKYVSSTHHIPRAKDNFNDTSTLMEIGLRDLYQTWGWYFEK